MNFIGNVKSDEELAKIEIINYLTKKDSKIYTNDSLKDLFEYNTKAFDKDYDECMFGLVEHIKDYMLEQDCDRIEQEICITGKYAYCDEFPSSNADIEGKNRIVESLYN